MRARKLVAGAALAVVVALAGCSVHPGTTAAVVDGREISPRDLEVAAEELTPIYGGGAPIDERTMLTVLILAPFFTAAADEAGVGVDAEDARESLTELMAAAEAPVPEWHEATIEAQRFVLAQQALGGVQDGGEFAVDALEAVRAADVDVNPRYGAWDDDAAAVGPAAPDWIFEDEPATDAVP